MRICPTCRTAYPARGRATCSKDGTRLVPAAEYAAARSDPLLGETIAERFRVVERVGTGGMGTVYRAEQVGLGRSVALKILKRELISDRDTVARFEREAKAMSMLLHPNTVRVFDFGEDEGGRLFLAMELLEGELLTSWIEREETPPVLEAIDVTRAILGSLSEAHSKSLIHRDLKPDNIFLAQIDGHARPVVKVLDFGIAKVFREELKIDQLETQAGTVFGTPRYMSPEQAQGIALDPRSDLYSVGVLLYQMLTGKPPFLDDDAVVVMAKHIKTPPLPPREAVPEQPVSRELERAVMRALAKKPADRFESADAFEAALERCIPSVEAAIAGRRPPAAFGPRTALGIGAALVLGAAVTAAAVLETDELSSAPTPRAEASAVLPTDEEEPGDVALPEPAPPERVSVELRSAPDEAEVWEGDEQVGTTPWRIELEETERRTVELRRTGYLTATVEIDAAEEVREVELARRPRTPRARPALPVAVPSAPSAPTAPSDDPYDRW